MLLGAESQYHPERQEAAFNARCIALQGCAEGKGRVAQVRNHCHLQDAWRTLSERPDHRDGPPCSRQSVQGMPTTKGTSKLFAPTLTCTRPSRVWPDLKVPALAALAVQRRR